MNSYISEKMALVGCGKRDIGAIQAECDTMGKKARDILDCWHNNGFNIPLSPEYQETAEKLKKISTNDELTCLGAYVSARRNLEEY